MTVPLVECPVCKGAVSPEAHACPHCGHPLKATPADRWRVNRSRAGGIIGLVLLAAIVAGVVGE